MLDMIAGGVLACAVVADYPGHEVRRDERVALGVVAVDPIFVALPATHPMAEDAEVELAALADEHWVVSPPDGTGWPEHFFEACDKAGFTPQTRFRVNPDGNLSRKLVGSSGAVSTVQSRFLPTVGVVVRPLAGTPMRMRHLIAWRRGGFLDGHSANLVAAAREAFRQDAMQAPVYQEWLREHEPIHSPGAIAD
jgi:DNA-binding transcriptional LysR family regulator